MDRAGSPRQVLAASVENADCEARNRVQLVRVQISPAIAVTVSATIYRCCRCSASRVQDRELAAG